MVHSATCKGKHVPWNARKQYRSRHHDKCQKYEKLRNITKKNYYNDAVLECDGNQSALFGIINKLLHKSSSAPPTYDNMDKLALDFAMFFEDISKIHNELIQSEFIDSPIADTSARSASIKLDSFDPVSE